MGKRDQIIICVCIQVQILCRPCARWHELHLVRLHQSGVWEVEGGDKQSHTFALHPVAVQVISYYPGHKVLPCTGPTMEGEGQGLVRLWVVNEALDSLQDHGLGQVLPMELLLHILSQTCTQTERTLCLVSWAYLALFWGAGAPQKFH